MSLNLFSRTLYPLRQCSNGLTLRWSSTSSATSSLSQLTGAFTSQNRSESSPQRPRLLSRRRLPNRQRFLDEHKAQGESRIYEKFQTREWKPGDVYSPHDMSPAEMKKWSKRQSPNRDAFDELNINPLDQYKNFAIMSEYMTPMGRIKHRRVTGLRPVNQRKIAKAIRRAIAIGLMPSVHRHPEILAAEAKARIDAGRAI
ncbi:hypothetical protein VTN31DRAFT_2676 [Thermomyces dupontii]|uniref:mitochondrial 37S ribosomal protein bS18m n=1 Tax=Talaromyces thermophilus TaxID=28565 RepID=UPI0037431EC6